MKKENIKVASLKGESLKLFLDIIDKEITENPINKINFSSIKNSNSRIQDMANLDLLHDIKSIKNILSEDNKT